MRGDPEAVSAGYQSAAPKEALYEAILRGALEIAWGFGFTWQIYKYAKFKTRCLRWGLLRNILEFQEFPYLN